MEQERQNYIRQERPKSSARQRAFARSGASTMIAIKPSEAAALGLNVHAIVEKSADDKSNDASVATEKPAVTTCIEISQNGKLPAEESVTTTDDRVVKAVKQDHHNSQIKADNVVSIASISSSNNLKASTTNQNSIKDSKQEELWGSLK